MEHHGRKGRFSGMGEDGLLGLWGGFLNSVELGYLEERPGELAIRLVTGSPRAQDGVFQWLRGTLEIFAAEYSHLKARAHLDQALDIFQAKKLKRAVLRTDKRFKWSSRKTKRRVFLRNINIMYKSRF